MKVQLQGQSLRLRIGEDELARLLDGQVVTNETRAGAAAMRQQLRAVDGDAVVLSTDGGAWAFGLPGGALRAYVARLPCRDALEFDVPGDAGMLRLAFEVDVRDSVRRRGPPARRAPRTAG